MCIRDSSTTGGTTAGQALANDASQSRPVVAGSGAGTTDQAAMENMDVDIVVEPTAHCSKSDAPLRSRGLPSLGNPPASGRQALEIPMQEDPSKRKTKGKKKAATAVPPAAKVKPPKKEKPSKPAKKASPAVADGGDLKPARPPVAATDKSARKPKTTPAPTPAHSATSETDSASGSSFVLSPPRGVVRLPSVRLARSLPKARTEGRPEVRPEAGAKPKRTSTPRRRSPGAPRETPTSASAPRVPGSGRSTDEVREWLSHRSPLLFEESGSSHSSKRTRSPSASSEEASPSRRGSAPRSSRRRKKRRGGNLSTQVAKMGLSWQEYERLKWQGLTLDQIRLQQRTEKREAEWPGRRSPRRDRTPRRERSRSPSRRARSPVAYPLPPAYYPFPFAPPPWPGGPAPYPPYGYAVPAYAPPVTYAAQPAPALTTPRDVIGTPPGLTPAPLPAQQLWQWQDSQRERLLREQGALGSQEPRRSSLPALTAKSEEQHPRQQ